MRQFSPRSTPSDDARRGRQSRLKPGKTIRGLIALLSGILIVGSLPLQSSIAGVDLDDPRHVIQQIENLNWITEEYPPFNYRDSSTGELTGASVEVLETIFRKLGVKKDTRDIKIYPWARGYHKVLNEPGSALFSTTYTYDRLQKMKFVGPVVPNVVGVIARKSDAIKISSAKDLERLRISVVRDDIGEQLLLAEGVPETAID